MTESESKTRAAVLTLHPLSNSQHKLKVLSILPDQTLTIGRSIETPETTPQADNAFYDSKSMSRRHCVFFLGFTSGEWDFNHVYVQDFGTANGTWVNGARIGSEGHASMPTPVMDSDKIGFAQTVEQDGVTYEGVEVVIGIELREG